MKKILAVMIGLFFLSASGIALADMNRDKSGKDMKKDGFRDHGDNNDHGDDRDDNKDHPKTATMTATLTAIRTSTFTPTPTATATSTKTATAIPTPQMAQAMVNLGSAANYVVLAYSSITNSGLTTLCGSLGLFPGTSVTGAPVVTCGGTTDIANAAANTAKLDLGIAYTDAAGRTGGALLPANAELGGQTLFPGLYTDLGTLSISSGNLTLNAQGNPNAVFIFQVNGVLSATTNRQVFLTGGAKAANVFWQVTGNCALGTGVSFKGNIMAFTAVTFGAGAVLEGRALALNADVTMLSNTITMPTP